MTQLATPTQQRQPVLASRAERIDGSIDKRVATQTQVSLGGMNFQNMGELMEFAKLMSLSQVSVPKHLRDNPGACLAVCIQAMEWRMSPYAVANKTYVVNDRLSFESQLVHAVIEQRAPITGRLRNKFIGEGDRRQCIVWATAKGESEPLEYTSSEFGKIQPKNSPLWKTKPDLQLFYNASRDWARMYFPDVIMGVYAEDELDQAPQVTASVSLNEKLRSANAHLPVRSLTHEPVEGSLIAVPGDEQQEVVNEDEAQAAADEAATAEVEAEKPKEPEDLSDFEKFRMLCHLAATENGIEGEAFQKAFVKAFATTKVKSGRRAEWEPARREILAAWRAGKIDLNTGTIIE